MDEGSAALPVSRMGLEHEFFLVDREGALSDLADLFLWECREAARAEASIRAVSRQSPLWVWSRSPHRLATVSRR